MAAIYLVRHGQASFGKRDYDALSERGSEQSRVLGQALKQRMAAPDRVVVGGMKRHRQTAMEALKAMGQPLHWAEDRAFTEYDHEDLIARYKPLYQNRALMMADLARTLKPREAFQAFFEQALETWVTAQKDGYRESFVEFKERVWAGMEALRGASGTTLVFTSGGAISAVVAALWDLPDSRWARLNRVIANGSVTKVVSGRSGLTLSTFNEHAHFEGEGRRLLSYR